MKLIRAEVKDLKEILDLQKLAYLSEAERFELFTGYNSTKNLYLYNKLGYNIFDEKQLNDKVKLVYLQKIK